MNDTQQEKTLETLFTNVGLSEKEARVYRILLTIGQGKAAEIVSKSGLKRGITYAVLYSLQQKGLVSILDKDKKTYFRAEPPQKLYDLVEKRKKEISTLQGNLKEHMPQLSSQYKLSVGKPTVRYFEGEEGLKEVFEDIYAPKADVVYGCVDLEKADMVFPAYIAKELIPKRIRNKLFAYTLLADSEQARKVHAKDLESLRKSLLVDKEEYPLPAEIDVYEDKIAMLSFAKGEFIGLVIENADLAQSLRSLYKLALRSKSASDK